MSSYQVKKILKDQVVFREDEQGDTAYLVKSGTIGIFKNIGGSDTQLAVLGAGEILGEMALLNKANRTATAKAMEYSELVAIERSQYLAMLKESPQFIASIVSGLVQRLGETTKRSPLAQSSNPYVSVCRIIDLMAKSLSKKEKVQAPAGPVQLNYAEAVKTIEAIIALPLRDINEFLNKMNALGLVAIKAIASNKKIIEIGEPDRFLEAARKAGNPKDMPL